MAYSMTYSFLIPHNEPDCESLTADVVVVSAELYFGEYGDELPLESNFEGICKELGYLGFDSGYLHKIGGRASGCYDSQWILQLGGSKKSTTGNDDEYFELTVVAEEASLYSNNLQLSGNTRYFDTKVPYKNIIQPHEKTELFERDFELSLNENFSKIFESIEQSWDKLVYWCEDSDTLAIHGSSNTFEDNRSINDDWYASPGWDDDILRDIQEFWCLKAHFKFD